MVKIDLPDLYTHKDVENARTKGELVGWVKGTALGVGGMLLLGVIGWIPTVAVLGFGGFVPFKPFSSPKMGAEGPPIAPPPRGCLRYAFIPMLPEPGAFSFQG